LLGRLGVLGALRVSTSTSWSVWATWRSTGKEEKSTSKSPGPLSKGPKQTVGGEVMSSAEGKGRSSYLDLLVSVLREHEKSLDELVEKMEKLTEELSKALQKTGEALKTAANKPENYETLIYLKLKINRPIEDVTRILKALKEEMLEDRHSSLPS